MPSALAKTASDVLYSAAVPPQNLSLKIDLVQPMYDSFSEGMVFDQVFCCRMAAEEDEPMTGVAAACKQLYTDNKAGVGRVGAPASPQVWGRGGRGGG